MTDITPHATLRNAYWDLVYGPAAIGGRLCGQVYNDTLVTGQHPFPDGKDIVTTAVEAKLGGGLFQTRSGTIYKVENWNAESAHKPRVLDTPVDQLPRSRNYRGSKPWEIRNVHLHDDGTCTVQVNAGWIMHFTAAELNNVLPTAGDSINTDRKLVRKQGQGQ